MIKNLKGRKVLGLFMNPEHDLVMFRCEGEDFFFRAYGDCCSECWIEHIDDPKDLIGRTILNVTEITMDVVLPGTRQEEDSLYCVEFETDGTYVNHWRLEFRNSSNGYYGGNLESTNQYGEKITQEEKDTVRPVTVKF